MVVRDTQAPTKETLIVPLYYQWDPRWASVPYAGATVIESGCGLCVFASALSCRTKSTITPSNLIANVGDSCTVENDAGIAVNDISLFISWGTKNYGIAGSDIYWNVNDAKMALEAGHLVIGSVSGQIRDREYAGHLVLLWQYDNQFYLFDPANEPNTGEISSEEMLRTDWVYFYTIY